MIKIKLKVISYLIYHTGFSEKELELPQSITIEELLLKINLKKKFPMLVICNGRKVNPSDKIQNGDKIMIAPLFSGG